MTALAAACAAARRSAGRWGVPTCVLPPNGIQDEYVYGNGMYVENHEAVSLSVVRNIRVSGSTSVAVTMTDALYRET